MTQRTNMKFVGATVTDDSTNDTTTVEFGGGSGHTIIDGDGNTMPQRSKLKFADNFTAKDDSANDMTIITSAIKIGDVSGASAINTPGNTSILLKWTDPENVVISGVTLVEWAGTKVIRKVGSAPADVTDGTEIIDNTTRNAYSSTGLTDSGLTYGETYYYRFFPYTTQGAVTDGSSVNVTPDRASVAVPTFTATMTYNGSQQTAAFTGYDSTKMTVSGNTGTNVGSYTAKFNVKPDYKWSDGTREEKSVTWTIGKKSVTCPTLSGTYTYTGSTQSVSVSSYSSSEVIVGGNTTAINAGTYTVTFDLADENYIWSDGTTEQKTASWMVNKANGSVTLSSSSVTLDSDSPSKAVIATKATGNLTLSSSNTSVATVSPSSLAAPGGTILIRGVNNKNGTATITVSVAASTNYNATSKTISVTADFAKIYGFHHNFSNLDPATCITYLSGTENENYSPMMTNEGQGTATAGSWATFLTDVLLNKPAMVKKDATLDYWLDPTDYTKKADGTASDYNNLSYSGAGAFSWIQKAYMKEVYAADGNSRDVYFAFGSKPDDTYYNVGFRDSSDELEGVWIPMGYMDASGRTLVAGTTPVASKTCQQEKAIIDTIGTRARFYGGAITNFMRDLMYMLYKHTDIQLRGGHGRCNAGSQQVIANANVTNGNVVGFKGTGDKKTMNKAFHSQLLFSYQQHCRDPYTLLVNGVLKYSDNYEYDINGGTYKTAGDTTWGSLSGGWHYGSHLLKSGDNFGSTPKKENNATDSTGLCDGLACDTSGVRVALRFGYCDYPLIDGPGCLNLTGEASTAAWNAGVGVLLLPPKGYAPAA